MLRKRFPRVLVTLALVLGSLVLTVSPASADHGDWHQSGCQGNVWWIETDVYDRSTGITWYDAYNWWIDYGYYGHSVYSTFGPIQGTWAGWGWECGPLGRPWSRVYYSHNDAQGYPVFRQGFTGGYIDWVTRNLCRCYNWGGFANVVRY